MTTGMSMAGRMSVFIRLVESSPKMAISEQSTAMVYGRRRARRTIHMLGWLRTQGCAAFDAAPARGMQEEKTQRQKHSAALRAAAGRFLWGPKRGLRGRHAPTGLRHRWG